MGLQMPTRTATNGLEGAAVALLRQDDDDDDETTPLCPPTVIGEAATSHVLPTIVITYRAKTTMPPHPHHQYGPKALFPPNKPPFLATPPTSNQTPHIQARSRNPTTHLPDSSPPKPTP